jgi:hypothetical protein
LDSFDAEGEKLEAIHLPQLSRYSCKYSTTANWLQISPVTNGQQSVGAREGPFSLNSKVIAGVAEPLGTQPVVGILCLCRGNCLRSRAGDGVCWNWMPVRICSLQSSGSAGTSSFSRGMLPNINFSPGPDEARQRLQDDNGAGTYYLMVLVVCLDNQVHSKSIRNQRVLGRTLRYEGYGLKSLRQN